MENTDIVDGAVGSVGSYELDLKDGNLVVAFKANLGPFKVGMTLELDSADVIDAIAKAIPGPADDVLLGVLKAALLKK